MSLPILLGLLALVPLLSVPLTGFLGRAAGWPIGVIFLGLAGAMVPSAIRVANGDVITWHAAWVPELGLDLALRLDGLSVIFIALALVIGALVFFYSTTYFTKGNQRGFYVIMTGFTFAMVALTVSDSLVLMFLTWELTSLASFLLIARSGHAGEAASMRTMLLTFIGGLALLAAVALIMARTGTSTFSQAIASPVWGSDPAFTGLIAVLVAAAGFSKAAQFPFHLWLPDAMAAATPVSAYLHAAAVVKAGIYLLFRFSIIFHSTLIWNVLLVGLGLFTSVLAAWFAMQQVDLKKLMAYSTVSQLGLITATIGVGTSFAIAAALLHTIAHACFKSGLFMVVGLIDHQAGTRMIDRLPALRRAMPVTFTVALVGTASMAGVPPLLGFISKENIFGALLDAPGPTVAGPILLAVAGLGAVLTFLYCGKIVTGAFLDGPEPSRPVTEARWVTILPPRRRSWSASARLHDQPLARSSSRPSSRRTRSPVTRRLTCGTVSISSSSSRCSPSSGVDCCSPGAPPATWSNAPSPRRGSARGGTRWLERVGVRAAGLVRADNPARHVAAIIVTLTAVWPSGRCCCGPAAVPCSRPGSTKSWTSCPGHRDGLRRRPGARRHGSARPCCSVASAWQ